MKYFTRVFYHSFILATAPVLLAAAFSPAMAQVEGERAPIYIDLRPNPEKAAPQGTPRPVAPDSKHKRDAWSEMSADEVRTEAATLEALLEEPERPLTADEKKRLRDLLKRVQAEVMIVKDRIPSGQETAASVSGEPQELQPLGDPAQMKVKKALDKPTKAIQTRNKVMDRIRESRYGATPWVPEEEEGESGGIIVQD